MNERNYSLKNNKGKEIDLKKVFDVIKHYLWIIIVITAMFTTASAIYSTYFKSYTPLYESSTRMMLHADGNFNNTLEVMISEQIILDKVIEELGLNTSSGALGKQITVGRVANSQVVKIAVTDPDPEMAAIIANAIANVYKRDIGKIINFNNVTILSEADVVPWPINPDTRNRTIIIGFIFGIIAGLGLLFLVDSLDDRIRSEHEIEELLETPLLGKIEKMKRKLISFDRKKQQNSIIRGEASNVIEE